MNERDKELAVQAGYKDLPTVRLAFYGFDKEKFAALIRADAMEVATRAANESWTLMCKKMVELEREVLKAEDWTAIMREGALVTWGDAEELGERVRAVIEARGNT